MILRAVQRLVMGLVAALLLPAVALAHLDEQHEAGTTTGPGERAPQVGVDERLGGKLPLDLTFRDEEGRPWRLSQLVSGPTIIVPVYYRCSNVCNLLQGELARVLPQIRRTPGTDYRVLSLSIDETETPQQAAASKRLQLAAMNSPFPKEGWRFLTGDAESIRRLTEAAGYRFQRRGHEFIHPVATLVVAGDGKIVRYLYGTSFLAKDLTLALVEAGAGRVGATVRQLVGYCFTFDPAARGYQFNLLRVSATVVLLVSGGFFLFLLVTGGRNRRRLGGK